MPAPQLSVTVSGGGPKVARIKDLEDGVNAGFSDLFSLALELASTGNAFGSVEAGQAATPENGVYSVPSEDEDGLFDFYKITGGEAVLFGTSADLSKLVASVGVAEGWAEAAKTESGLSQVAREGAEVAKGQSETAASNAQNSARSILKWSDGVDFGLSYLTPAVIGEGGEVLDADEGNHVDPLTGFTVDNAGRYSAYALTVGAWTRIGDTGLSNKLNRNERGLPNIWVDPFFEGAKDRPYVTNQRTTLAGTLNEADGTSPYGTPYLSYTSGNNVQATNLVEVMGVLEGDVISISTHCYFVGGTGQVTLYFRGASGILLTESKTLSSEETGEQLLDFRGITVPTGTNYIEARMSQGGGGSLFAVAMCKGDALPAFGFAATDYTMKNTQQTQKNLWPDPFLRQFDCGISHHGGWSRLGQTAGLDYPVFDTSTNSPFKSERVLRFPTGSGQLDFHIDAKRLGLKAGDKLTVKLGVYSAQTINLSVFGRRSSDLSTVGDTGSTLFYFPDTNSREISVVVDVDAVFAKECDILVVRFGNALTVGATDVEIWGSGVFVNETDPMLFDDTYVADMAAVTSFRQLPFNTQTLRQANMRLTRLLFGSTSVMSFGFMGDSFSHLLSRYVGPFYEAMVFGVLGGEMALGSAGLGWIGFGNPNSDATGNINGSVSSDITVTTNGGIPSSNYTGAASPDIGSVTFDNSGEQYRVNNLPADTDRLTLSADINTGVIEYSTDAGLSWTEIDLSTGTNVHLTDLTIPATSFNLWVRFVSGTCNVHGVYHRKGDSGVIVNKLGATGSTAAQWAAQAVTPEWRAALAALELDTVCIMLATNGQISSTLAIRYKEYMRTIIEGVSAALPDADIMILMPAENQRLVINVEMAAYASAARELATELGIAFHDFQEAYGRHSEDYAHSGTRPWFADDLTHPDSDSAIDGGFPMAGKLRKIMLF